MTMPNFLIIGANKAGTTSLYYYLQQHPQVYMSPVKEPMFFTSAGTHPEGSRLPHPTALGQAIANLEDYEALFADVDEEKAIGEASTAYLHNPQAAQRIKQSIPDVKLIAVLRHPVERAYSNYVMYCEWGLENRDFARAVREKDDRVVGEYPPGRLYVELGFYYNQLRRYLDTFNQEQLKIYLYDDLRKDPLNLLKDILRFLGVEGSFVPDLSTKYNESGLPRSKAVNALLTRSNRFTSILKSIVPPRLRQPIANRIRSRNLLKPPPLAPEIRWELIEVYKDDILKVQDLIQRDLSRWLA